MPNLELRVGVTRDAERKIERLVRTALDPTSINNVFFESVQAAREAVVGATPGSEKFRQGWRIQPGEKNEAGFITEFRIVHSSNRQDLLRWLDAGTKPHVIVPRNAKVLRFTVSLGGGSRARVSSKDASGGKSSTVIYSARVKHPGTRPYRMAMAGEAKLSKALPDIIRKIKAFIRSKGNK